MSLSLGVWLFLWTLQSSWDDLSTGPSHELCLQLTLSFLRLGPEFSLRCPELSSILVPIYLDCQGSQTHLFPSLLYPRQAPQHWRVWQLSRLPLHSLPSSPPWSLCSSLNQGPALGIFWAFCASRPPNMECSPPPPSPDFLESQVREAQPSEDRPLLQHSAVWSGDLVADPSSSLSGGLSAQRLPCGLLSSQRPPGSQHGAAPQWTLNDCPCQSPFSSAVIQPWTVARGPPHHLAWSQSLDSLAEITSLGHFLAQKSSEWYSSPLAWLTAFQNPPPNPPYLLPWPPQALTLRGTHGTVSKRAHEWILHEWKSSVEWRSSRVEPIARDRSLSTEPGSVGWIRDKAPPRGRDRAPSPVYPIWLWKGKC